MATLKQYARQLWITQRSVCEKLGVKIAWSSLEQRVLVISSDVNLAMLVKILTDKGVITDAELQAVATQVRNADFPPLVHFPPPDDDEFVTPDPDLGS